MIAPEDSSLSRGRSSSKPRPVVSGLVVAFVLGTLALVAVRSLSSASGPAIKIDAARVPPEKIRSLLALADGTPSLHHLATLPVHLSTLTTVISLRSHSGRIDHRKGATPRG